MVKGFKVILRRLPANRSACSIISVVSTGLGAFPSIALDDAQVAQGFRGKGRRWSSCAFFAAICSCNGFMAAWVMPDLVMITESPYPNTALQTWVTGNNLRRLQSV